MPSELERTIAAGKQRLAETETATRERLKARYNAAWSSIETELRMVERRLADFDAGILIDGQGRYTRRGLLWRQERLSGLLRLIEEEYTRLAIDGAHELAGAQRRVVTLGMLDAPQIAAAQGITSGTGAALNVQAYERLIAATDSGSPVVEILKSYGDEAADVIERALIEGAIQGHGIDDILRAILQQLTGGVSPWRLETLIRTELLRSYRGSLFESYKAMGVEQWQWVAALTSRTCPACLAMHGKVFPMSQDFMPTHPNCRCVNVPFVEGIGGPTGDEWLREQSEKDQRKIFPTRAHYEAFQNGMPLSEMTGMHKNRTWGDSVYVKPARELAGAA